MSVSYLAGNLFDSQAQALAHGVNCRGVMGKGIAKEFRSHYPDMYSQYRLECLFERLRPGEVYTWCGDDKIIFNLATQDKPGPDATYKNVSDCLKKMRSLANQLEIKSISMPGISCGIGGPDWELVKEIVEDVFGDWEGELSVYNNSRLNCKVHRPMVEFSPAKNRDKENNTGNSRIEWRPETGQDRG